MVTQMIDQHRARMRAIRADRTIHTLGATYEAHAFHAESKYPAFLNGRDAAQLEALFDLNDYHAAFLVAAILQVLADSQAKLAQTSRPALCQLNSFSQDQIRLKPLRALQNPETLKHYARVLRSFLIFLLNSSQPAKPAAQGLYQLDLGAASHLDCLRGLLQQLPSTGPNTAPCPASQLPAHWMDQLDSDQESTDDEAPAQATATTARQGFGKAQLQEGAVMIMYLIIQLAEQPAVDPMVTPLYAFTACFARNYARDCFKYVGVISQAYSALIRCHQYVYLAWFHAEIDTDDQDGQVSQVRDWMRQHFMAQSESPLGHLLALRNIALYLICYDTSIGEVSLVAPHVIQYRQLQVSRDGLTACLVRAIKDLAGQLCTELLLGFEQFRQFEAKGFTLAVAAQAGAEPVPAGGGVGPGAPARMVRGGQRQPGAPPAPRAPVSGGQLLALCHLTAGAPARGSEMNQVLWRNSTTTRRNLFLDPVTRLCLIRLGYSKIFSQSGETKTAVRALPQALSYLVMVYLVVVRPFEEFLVLERSQQPALPDQELLLFYSMKSERIVSPRSLSWMLRQLTGQSFSQPITISSWRHLAQAFIRHGLGEDPDAELEDEDQDLDLEALGAQQMHHTRQRGQLTYGRQAVSFQG
ncbi:hypothetical protein BDV09DRAFT_201535, partial [Aspergillus tetrazonus]